TIVRAGRTLARRFGLPGPWRYLPVLGASGLAAGFVALVLSDPHAVRRHQAVLAQVARWSGSVPVLVAGSVLAVRILVVVVLRRRRSRCSRPRSAASRGAPPSVVLRRPWSAADPQVRRWFEARLSRCG